VMAEAGAPWFVLERMNRWLFWRAFWQRTGPYLQAVSKLQQIARQIVAFCHPYDAILLPTYMHGAIRVGEWRHQRPRQILENIIRWIGPCPPFNASGQPAIAIPTGFTDQGLPLGVQLVGRPADEATLFALAAQLEAQHPWSQQRPAMARE